MKFEQADAAGTWGDKGTPLRDDKTSATYKGVLEEHEIGYVVTCNKLTTLEAIVSPKAQHTDRASDFLV